MNKEEAAAFLEIGVRSLERYTTQGRVTAQKVKGKTGPVLDYSAEELARFKVELQTPPPTSPGAPPTEETALAKVSPANLARSAASSAATARSKADRQESAAFIAAQVIQGCAVKLMLTVDEAAAFTGTGHKAINDAIKAGVLTAHYGFGRGRRVKRADLEKWIESL